MFLESVRLFNFRKFGLDNNTIKFVEASFNNSKDGQDINVASTTTLIVGKNNAGKTTVIEALDKLIKGKRPTSKDFNFFYLKELFANYKVNIFDELPSIKFEFEIGLDKGKEDYITNIVPFMVLGDVDAKVLRILAKYELTDEEIFKESIKVLFRKKYKDNVLFSKLLEIIEESDYKISYYNRNERKVERFSLGDLMELAPIKANNVTSDNCLSNAYNKIIKYRYEELFQDEKERLENQIIKINADLTKNIEKNHTKTINFSLQRVLSADKLQVLLSADLSFKKFMDNLVKYEYIENGNYIPEEQFGLGYTNLMMIIANIIDYMESYPNIAFNSKINLISIEEPETYMHPQMQELFIKHINDAIATLLSMKHKNVNSQLIITTHSSHILNSKIHTGGSFNNINYITIHDKLSCVINLNDRIIAPNSITEDKDFEYIKKHIKFKVSDLFFADAAILVEGTSEYNLLPYYIDNDRELKKYFITIVNIDGAHGLVYKNLLKALKIPALIVTDLDIKRDAIEKEEYKQIRDLKGRITTNKTLIAFNEGKDDIEGLGSYLQEDNIYILYQNKSYGFYAASFEEAFILKNYNNKILNDVLIELKPGIYAKIVGPSAMYQNNKKSSYMWQEKLSKSKSAFSNEILYHILTAKDDIPMLPDYIERGFKILKNKLKRR